MRTRAGLLTAATGLAATVVLLGSTQLGYGGTTAKQASQLPAEQTNPTFEFVDSNLNRTKTIVNYQLPMLPPGPYAVSLFAGIEPAGDWSDPVGCEVSVGGVHGHRILVTSVEYTQSFATFVSGATTTRLFADSEIRATCSAESLEFRLTEPLRISFTRLDRMETTRLTPSSVS